MADTTETKKPAAVAAQFVLREGVPAGLTFTFGDGRAPVTLTALPDWANPWALWHGVKQKCVDAAAISRNPETGASATIADKAAAVMAMIARLTDPEGDWNKAREGGGSDGLLLAALCRLQPGKTKAEHAAWLETKSPAEQAALRRNAKVAPIIEAIRAERAKADTVDSDALLEELGLSE